MGRPSTARPVCSFCLAESFGAGPGCGLAASAFTPPSSQARFQRFTLETWTPTRSAISGRGFRAWKYSAARRRRASSSVALPLVLMHPTTVIADHDGSFTAQFSIGLLTTMNETVQGFQTIEEVRRFVAERLGRLESLKADQYELTQRVLYRSGQPCGMQFSLQGPRAVVLTQFGRRNRTAFCSMGRAGDGCTGLSWPTRRRLVHSTGCRESRSVQHRPQHGASTQDRVTTPLPTSPSASPCMGDALSLTPEPFFQAIRSAWSTLPSSLTR